MDAHLDATRKAALRTARRSTAVVLAIPNRVRPGTIAALLLAALALGTVAYGTGYTYRPITGAVLPRMTLPALPESPQALQKEIPKLRSQQRRLEGQLRQKGPHGVHVIIDQTHNRLYLKKDDEVLHEAVCSAGSGMVLKEGDGGKRRWVFDTPRGQFRVLQKIQNPVWKKPDWAFVEEGKPIPRNPSERFEYGTLGEYALYFGDGYMIHGTLYERLLGRSVTHGCIRLGRDDLRKVYATASLGTPIYVY